MGFGEFGTAGVTEISYFFPTMAFAMTYFRNRKQLGEERKAIRAVLG